MEAEKTGVEYIDKSGAHEAVENDVGAAVQLSHDVTAAKYSPWTASMWRLYGCLWVAYLCGCLNGYDGSLMGGVNAMTSYQEFFKV